MACRRSERHSTRQHFLENHERSLKIVTAEGRPLTDLERHVLAHLLSVNFAGVNELREQVRLARVAHNWKPDGSPSFDIWLPPDVPVSSFDGNQAPIEAHVSAAEDPYIGEMILWINNGKISALEYSWVTDDPPTILPNPSSIHMSLIELLTRGK
jgi:hypothetical protein